MSESDTPRTDDQSVRYYDDATGTRIEYVAARFARQLERELSGAVERRQNLTDENIRLKSELTAASELVKNLEITVLSLMMENKTVTEQRDAIEEARVMCSNAYVKAAEQRDRLAEAMKQMWPFIKEHEHRSCNTPEYNVAILKYREALQSLSPKDHE
jgi:predicted ATP-dependent endonuclease of OLD family